MKAHVTVLDPQKAYKEVIENADLTEVSMYLAYRYFVMQMKNWIFCIKAR